MRRTIPVLLLAALVFYAGLPAPAQADWNVGDSCKMHYPQMPDLTMNGMDVSAMSAYGYLLADDFYCIQSGPITNIHIWGSWWQDVDDPTASFKLSIHGDIPAGQVGAYSMPSNPALWEAVFSPAQYQRRLWAGGISEGWFEPPSSYTPPPADTNCYQYNFPINPQAAFVQTSGTVYWLDVQMLNDGTESFGWKTSSTNWNDDAVYSYQGGAWNELRYPLGHPLHPQSIDLSFVIQGAEEEPPPPSKPLCPKWLQPPDCDIGLDVESRCLMDDMEGAMPMVADDWLCDGRTVNGIRWWGSYIGWSTNDPNPELPPPTGNRPAGFYVKWYTDVPAAGEDFSRPGTMLASNYYPLATYGDTTVLAGLVIEQTACVSHLTFISEDNYEHEYVYYLEFPASNVWNEKEGRVYWLSIQAVYAGGALPNTNRWGWKTTPVWFNWNDDAVFIAGSGTNELTYPPIGWGWAPDHPYKGNSVNMAFELLTDICPSRCKKWAQPPDMITGVNAPSWTLDTAGYSGVLRADDFISDGRPITDIHWWGSYIGWESYRPGDPTEPVPPPTGVNAPLGFNLSWHVEASGGGCVPGPAITNIFVSLTNCHETYYGSVAQFWKLPQPPMKYEHEYQYYVDLLDQDLGLEAWFETNEVHYWLNIQAVFPTGFEQELHQGWGWKITPALALCQSAVDKSDGLGWTNEMLGAIDFAHPRAGQPFDLSFELTTTEIGTNANNVTYVVFTNVYRFPTMLFLPTTGYCGCGKLVLQESLRLGGDVLGPENWVDIQTNFVPRPQNLWQVSPLSTQRFFRVKQVP